MNSEEIIKLRDESFYNMIHDETDNDETCHIKDEMRTDLLETCAYNESAADRKETGLLEELSTDI